MKILKIEKIIKDLEIHTCQDSKDCIKIIKDLNDKLKKIELFREKWIIK